MVAQLWNVCGTGGEQEELGKKAPIRRVFRYSASGELLDGDNSDKHYDDSADDDPEFLEDGEIEEDDYLDEDDPNWGDEE
jgi:hypothetical protein